MNSQSYDLGPDFSDGMEGPDRSLLDHCLGLIEADSRGWAVEFGTGTGATTRMIAKRLPVISFDSFQGLPEDWRPDFPAGRFAEQEMPRDIPGATIVPGWFMDTVPDYDWPDDLALVHFDADLYSSTLTCLSSIGPFIKPGCILVFDEFHGFTDDLMGDVPGEQQAWREYAEAVEFEWDVIGRGREQWAIQITKGSKWGAE